ncbi:hypothetical protein K3495_g8535 [Podosphaera aphanis]|nr:hypothetical protein K3495_g8535 [Podosphaera aphanis]
MDELPVSFGPQPERSTDGTFEKADLDRAMEILLEIVWHNGGFRYRKRYTNANIFATHSIVLKILTNLAMKSRQKSQETEAK